MLATNSNRRDLLEKSTNTQEKMLNRLPRTQQAKLVTKPRSSSADFSLHIISNGIILPVNCNLAVAVTSGGLGITMTFEIYLNLHLKLTRKCDLSDKCYDKFILWEIIYPWFHLARLLNSLTVCPVFELQFWYCRVLSFCGTAALTSQPS